MNITAKGLTLVELLMVVAILAILATVALPSMSTLIAETRIRSGTMALGAMMKFARMQAVARNTRVTLCPSNDGAVCGEANEWNRGVMVFEDMNENRHREEEENLLGYREMNRNLQIFSGADPASTGRSRKRIVFSPAGSAAGYTISVKFCSPDASASPEVLILQNSGRIRLSDQDGSGREPACES
ncbi:MAG: GspH/FimT family pseudopilin [Chromatiales bacterium]|jgi:type IV fimbrial biogenesis protein FimT